MVSRRRFLILGATLTASSILTLGLKFLPLHKYFSIIPKVSANSIGTSDIFCVSGYPSYLNDKHIGLEKLFNLMGSNGLYLLKSQNIGTINGPEGLIEADDVVLIKINCQWGERGGTNTSLVKGLIQTIIQHPDGFTGEIIVIDNGQGRGRFDWENPNAEDTTQCIQNVVDSFNNEKISTFLWDNIRSNLVKEYDQGNMHNGYVFENDPETTTGMRFNYPKFKTTFGTYISLKKGIWNDDSKSYSNEKLKLINFPVLKTHGFAGVTSCIKHYMGVISQKIINNHPFIRNGGLAAEMAYIRFPTLNILDAIYVNPHPMESGNAGPETPYSHAVRMNQIIAGLDPIAIDYWASKNILIPAAKSLGYSSYSSMDPDTPNEHFHDTLINSMNVLLGAGIQATTDPSKINLYLDKAHAQLTLFIDGILDVSKDYGSQVQLSGSINPATKASIRLSHSTDGGSTWNNFMTTNTDESGEYNIPWFPPHPDTYILKAKWSSNDDYLGDEITPPYPIVTVIGSKAINPKLLISTNQITPIREDSFMITTQIFGGNKESIGTLMVNISGPNGYNYQDFMKVSVPASSHKTYVFKWDIPGDAPVGMYKVEAELIPPKLSAYDFVYFQVR